MNDDQPLHDDQPMCAGYRLVMPFIACRSNGGEWDDDAFVAGWVASAIDGDLRRKVPQPEYTVRPALLPQIDLIAMHRGFTTTVTWQDDDWATVKFARVEAI